MLKDHLEQLVKTGHLKEFFVRQEEVHVGQGSGGICGLGKKKETKF